MLIKSIMFLIFVIWLKYTFSFWSRPLSYFDFKPINIWSWSITYFSYGFNIITRFLFFTYFRMKDSSIIMLNRRVVDIMKSLILKSAIIISAIALISFYCWHWMFLVMSLLLNLINIRILKLALVNVDLLIFFLKYITKLVSWLINHY